ncbi:fructose-bisphosphate aldolase class I [Marinobacter daepoensis]|uniref:fructose-bisphosphate aldolase n=1 Tax=Marinobacter daepoensis TaxID=262077 RepID=A0ABS3BF21_9GAMM|nr:class I fructose-bisphosphate aldolase [Marinobacter daepoensis]MBN7769302.1 fructose-bisphosphate aldolase class I [Marinobacter daepoensis]MBY6032037.1 fructose-bisphosphate aldolase class I [Marinobacter daepoensis]MBY6077992.1 fructose-bisphosphate aldolase class I [Marinobacter daepoensis]
MSIQEELNTTIADLVRPGRGILAADESTPTIAKRFSAVGVESTEASRREYRSLIFSTPGLGEHISGVILYEETLQQLSLEDVAIPRLLCNQGIVPGIKVDMGKGPLVNAPGDEITYGLDGLSSRLERYKSLGARFAKWRDVFHISDVLPSSQAIRSNAEVLARYAAVCQAMGIVPIVEPEVLMDGPHSISRAADVSEEVLLEVFKALHRHQVSLEQMVLKPSMVTPGKASRRASPEEVAHATLAVFRRAVPAAVPGIFFLSGGQTPEEATDNLNALNRLEEAPWALSFSYGRALQEPAQKAWAGQRSNAGATQAALIKRARLNGLARSGAYAPLMEADD